MKIQKNTVFAILFAGLAVFCLFTACEQPTDPAPEAAVQPTATPAGGNYTSAQAVTLTTTTQGAAIHYTLDGTDPTASSPLYSSPITISETTTLKAIATKTGWTNSDILTETYTITIPPEPEKVVQPTATPAGGNYTSVQTVTLTTITEGAAIHYTLNGTTPTASSTLYSSPITISETTTLKAIAIKAGMTNSDILTETYALPGKVARPVATPAGGNYTSVQIVNLTTATPDAAIFYTLDGTDPSTGSSYYTSAITISETKTLKAIAIKTDMIDSDILTVTYTIGCTVTFYADGGTPAPASLGSVNPGSTITQPPAMTKALHTFADWYTDSARTVPAVFPITVNDNINLYAKWNLNTFTSVTDVSGYLASLQNNTIDNPVSLTLSLDLGSMPATGSGWRQLLDAINTTGKYVNLDLSDCTMTVTSFNPDYSVTTGKNRIISIVLPTAATSIAGGSIPNPTFKNFSNLKSINGAVTTIGSYAFYSCSTLQNAGFPQTTSIGYDAFLDCTSLQSVSFSASAQLIGISNSGNDNPFGRCISLTSFTLNDTGDLSVIENGRALVRNETVLIAYPSASGTITMNTITSIDNGAFEGCTGLTSVTFSQATSIGNSAFINCTNLLNASFPQVTTIGYMVFYRCSSLQSLNIPQVTSIGSDAFSYNETTTLSITMGSAAPTLGDEMFSDITAAKTVTVKIPTGATGYSPASSPFTGTAVTVDNDTENWANGLRGGGWNGSTWDSNGGPEKISYHISVIIEQQ